MSKFASTPTVYVLDLNGGLQVSLRPPYTRDPDPTHLREGILIAHVGQSEWEELQLRTAPSVVLLRVSMAGLRQQYQLPRQRPNGGWTACVLWPADQLSLNDWDMLLDAIVRPEDVRAALGGGRAPASLEPVLHAFRPHALGAFLLEVARIEIGARGARGAVPNWPEHRRRLLPAANAELAEATHPKLLGLADSDADCPPDLLRWLQMRAVADLPFSWSERCYDCWHQDLKGGLRLALGGPDDRVTHDALLTRWAAIRLGVHALLHDYHSAGPTGFVARTRLADLPARDLESVTRALQERWERHAAPADTARRLGAMVDGLGHALARFPDSAEAAATARQLLEELVNQLSRLAGDPWRLLDPEVCP